MELDRILTHPLIHPYYRLVKNMYHPVLYDNHLYSEMEETKIKELLAERDDYIKAIALGDICITLTRKEYEWICYLRDCCLFELHRRKYKLVLADIMKLTHGRLYATGDWKEPQLSVHSKVILWLQSHQNEFETDDIGRETDETAELVPLEALASNEDEKLPAGLTKWPEYPRILAEECPQLFEPRTDLGYIKSRSERTYVLQLVAERRNKAIRQYKRRAEGETRKKEQNEVSKEQKEQKPEEKKRKGHNNYEEKIELEQRGKVKRFRRTDEVLGHRFVETAIKFALYNQEPPQIQIPCAEQATTSRDDRVFITWDEIREAIDMMNDDIRNNMHKLMTNAQQRRVVRIDYTPTDSSNDSSSEIAPIRQFPKRPIPLFTKKTKQITTTKKNDCKYIQPGTYTVPKTSSGTHIKKGQFKLITVPEEIEAPNLAIKQSPGKYGEASTSKSPPSVPEFDQSATESSSSQQSQLSLIPSRKRPASYLDDDFKSITSEDIKNATDPDLYSSISETEPPEEFLAPSSPRISYKDSNESSISETDILNLDNEPDFTGLPLPETPDDEDNKQP